MEQGASYEGYGVNVHGWSPEGVGLWVQSLQVSENCKSARFVSQASTCKPQVEVCMPSKLAELGLQILVLSATHSALTQTDWSAAREKWLVATTATRHPKDRKLQR